MFFREFSYKVISLFVLGQLLVPIDLRGFESRFLAPATLFYQTHKSRHHLQTFNASERLTIQYEDEKLEAIFERHLTHVAVRMAMRVAFWKPEDGTDAIRITIRHRPNQPEHGEEVFLGFDQDARSLDVFIDDLSRLNQYGSALSQQLGDILISAMDRVNAANIYPMMGSHALDEVVIHAHASVWEYGRSMQYVDYSIRRSNRPSVLIDEGMLPVNQLIDQNITPFVNVADPKKLIGVGDLRALVRQGVDVARQLMNEGTVQPLPLRESERELARRFKTLLDSTTQTDHRTYHEKVGASMAAIRSYDYGQLHSGLQVIDTSQLPQTLEEAGRWFYQGQIGYFKRHHAWLAPLLRARKILPLKEYHLLSPIAVIAQDSIDRADPFGAKQGQSRLAMANAITRDRDMLEGAANLKSLWCQACLRNYFLLPDRNSTEQRDLITEYASANDWDPRLSIVVVKGYGHRFSFESLDPYIPILASNPIVLNPFYFRARSDVEAEYTWVMNNGTPPPHILNARVAELLKVELTRKGLMPMAQLTLYESRYGPTNGVQLVVQAVIEAQEAIDNMVEVYGNDKSSQDLQNFIVSLIQKPQLSELLTALRNRWQAEAIPGKSFNEKFPNIIKYLELAPRLGDPHDGWVPSTLQMGHPLEYLQMPSVAI